MASVQVRVPASTTNLGPGFDVLGMALNLYNTFEISESDKLEIDI
jgi:homoserine kinase